MSKIDRLSLAFVGDISLGGDTRRHLDEQGSDYWWQDVRDELASCDLRIANFECTLVPTERAEALRHIEMAVARPHGASFRNAGFEIVTIANNHVMDCGAEGLDTLRGFLDEAGIAHFGAGPTRAEAEKTLYYEHGGRTIALLGVCDAVYHYADGDSPGIAPLDWSGLKARVREARARADLVIAHVHADLEFTAHPSMGRVRRSRKLAEAGAHLVIEHHPHVFQGIETHKDSLIAYSLGNFVFDWSHSEYMKNHAAVMDTHILKVFVEFTDAGPRVTWEAVPCAISETEYRPVPATGADREQRLARLQQLCDDLARPSVLRGHWRKRAGSELRMQLKAAYYAMRKQGFRQGMADLWALVARPDHRAWLKGALTFGWR